MAERLTRRTETFGDRSLAYGTERNVPRQRLTLQLEHDNMRAALEHAISSGRGAEASRLVLALWRFWQTRGYIIEARQWCERVLALPDLAPVDRLRALEAAGGIAYWQGEPDAVKRYYQEAYDIARASGTPAERANAAYNLSFTFFVVIGDQVTPDPARARPLLEEAIEARRGLGERAGMARASWALASVLQQATVAPSREQLEQALAHAREALAEHRILGNRFDTA